MVLLKPVISEQSFSEASKGRFSFVVTRDATRPAIKKAVENAFSVTVKKIEVSKIPAKTYRAGKQRIEKKTVGGKKAIVTLAKDQKIDLFEVGQDA